MEKKKIISGALVLASFLLLLGPSLAYAEFTPPLASASSYINIDVEEVHEMLEKNPDRIILLDVRTEGEYAAEYIPGAINIPKGVLEIRLDELDNSKIIIVYCKSGGRSRTASETLAQHDFSVYNMLGGINAWKEKFATSTATPTPIEVPTGTPSPAVSPTPEEEKQVPGFEVTFALAAISLIAWCLLKKRNIF